MRNRIAGAVIVVITLLLAGCGGHEGSTYLIRHEAVHVRQWHRYGVVRFLLRFVGAYVKWRMCRKGHCGAYRRIPFEIEADWVARRAR